MALNRIIARRALLSLHIDVAPIEIGTSGAELFGVQLDTIVVDFFDHPKYIIQNPSSWISILSFKPATLIRPTHSPTQIQTRCPEALPHPKSSARG